jgi:DHA3 family macrolide efflux protein-like MFS transporter
MDMEADHSIRKFVVIWAGQMVSLIGSGLTGFALGIWIYQRTGSVTRFALISVCVLLPGILISPLSGALVDRFNRRSMMMLSDIAAGCGSLVLALLFFSGTLTPWKIYVLVSIASVARAIRMPSYMALLSQLVPVEQVGRTSGMMQMGPAAASVLSPMLAAFLLDKINFQGVVAIDFATFAVAVATLLAVHVPTLPARKKKRSLLKESFDGWRYIAERPGLIALLIFFAVINVSNSASQVLFTPMILSFANRAVLGNIMSIAALGFLAGGIIMSAWGGPGRRVHGILGFSLVYSLALILGGLKASAFIVTIALFLIALQVPIINGCSQAIWQTKTALEMQGRVFSTRMMVAWSSAPLASLLAGDLADRVFEPMFAVDGRMAHSWLAAIGTGPGRGAAFLLILNGMLALAVTVGCYFNRRLWYVEQELPDMMPAQRPSAATV